MKFYIVHIMLWFSVAATAEPEYPDPPSVHGMLIMGQQVIYASHLPMFHSPHDYQIILSLQLDEQAREVYLSDRAEHPEQLVYTIEPEEFVLPEKVKQRGDFRAHVYRGHFERGGKRILHNVIFNIIENIYFKQLEENAKHPDRIHYILFGNENEQFMAHLITAKPDFDELLQVKVAAGRADLRNTGYVLLRFPEHESRNPYSWKTDTATIVGTSQVVQLTESRRLYLEYGDLN